MSALLKELTDSAGDIRFGEEQEVELKGLAGLGRGKDRRLEVGKSLRVAVKSFEVGVLSSKTSGVQLTQPQTSGWRLPK